MDGLQVQWVLAPDQIDMVSVLRHRLTAALTVPLDPDRPDHAPPNARITNEGAGVTQQINMTSDEDVRARVDALLAEMTPQEKAGQLTQYFYMDFMRDQSGDGAPSQPEMVEAAMARSGVGSLLFLTDAAEINRLQKATVEGNRLGIPALVGFDVIHGFRTIMPVPIAMAASWDPDVIEQGQAVAAREARSVGIHWAFAPMVDIARDPRWGRIIEGAGEDPYLGGAVAAAQVRGFQGGRLGTPERVISGPKHFAGYGAAQGGRDYDESNISDAELWNVYFPPFQAAIEAGAGNIMSAYMDLNGVPASGNRWLLNEVLRDALGFDGFVVSDAQAVHNLVTQHFAADLPDAARPRAERRQRHGDDLRRPGLRPPGRGRGGRPGLPRDPRHRGTSGAGRPRSGSGCSRTRTWTRRTRSRCSPTRRTARSPRSPRSARLCCSATRATSSRWPPISLSSIAVIGPLADSQRDTLGPWIFNHDLAETVTILDGIKARAGDGVEVRYAAGCPSVVPHLPVHVRHVGGQHPR